MAAKAKKPKVKFKVPALKSQGSAKRGTRAPFSKRSDKY